MPGESRRPSAETVEWAKALVAAGLTDDVVAELLELVRQGDDDRAEMAAWVFVFGEIPLASEERVPGIRQRRGSAGPPARRSAAAERAVFGERTHRFDAPTVVLFDALTVDLGKWLPLQPGEVLPVVLESVRPGRVVWSSPWPPSPDDTIEFELTRAGAHTMLWYRWWTDRPPDARGIGITRQRINRKLGGELRGWLAAHGPGWEHPSAFPRPAQP